MNARPPKQNADVVLAVGLVGLLAVLLMPLPAWLLDLLLAINLSCSILVLLLVLGLRGHAGSVRVAGSGVAASWLSLVAVAAWGTFRLARAPL